MPRDTRRGPSRSRCNQWDRPVWRHPGRGVVVEGGVDAGRRAQRWRDRARRLGTRARVEWRSYRGGGELAIVYRELIITLGCPAQIARSLFRTLLRHGWRSDLLLIRSTRTGARQATSIESSKAKSPATCRCRRRPNSSSLSISRPRKRWTSQFRRRCSRVPMR
jgi:hypothetical protein